MQTISILLVDHNPTFIEMTARFLNAREQFAVVGTASSEQDALKEARKLQPQVVLLDLRLSEQGSLELIPKLRRLRQEMSIIALSFFEAEIYQRAAIAVGADDFVSKVTLHRDLLPAITRCAKCTEMAGKLRGRILFEEEMR